MTDKNLENLLKVSLVYIVQGEEHPFTLDIPLSHTPDINLIPLAVTEAFAEIKKDTNFADFYDEMPDPEFLGKAMVRNYAPDDWFTEKRMLQQNTNEVWREIVGTLISVRYLLAQARAYKDVELTILKEVNNRTTEEVLNVHLSKMHAFDMAVYRLAKIEDLFLLLLFVNLGNSLVRANPPSKDWEKQIVWGSVAKGLQERHPKAVSNRYLNQLSDEEYDSVTSIFNKFKSPTDVQKIIAYRDATTHRIPPSVDYTGLSGLLVFQKSVRTDGKIAPEDFRKAYTIDHQFLDLYETAKSAFRHYVQVLGELKAVPRFA